MKRLIVIISLLFSLISYSQENDSIKTKIETDLQFSIATRNLWRGIIFGNSPSLQTLLICRIKSLEIGLFGTLSTNGSRLGYPNTTEAYISYYKDGFALSLSDYYFFNTEDSLNDYFDYSKTTQHFLEARLKYSNDKIWILGGYNVYSGSWVGNYSTFPYVEIGYTYENISFFIGGVTNKSTLNFMEKGGITNIGIKIEKPIILGSLSAYVVYNPNYRYITDIREVGKNPINLVGILTFK